MEDPCWPSSAPSTPFLTFCISLNTHFTPQTLFASYSGPLNSFTNTSKYLLTLASGMISISPSYILWPTTSNPFSSLEQQTITIQNTLSSSTLIWQRTHTKWQTTGMNTAKWPSGWNGRKRYCNIKVTSIGSSVFDQLSRSDQCPWNSTGHWGSWRGHQQVLWTWIALWRITVQSSFGKLFVSHHPFATHQTPTHQASTQATDIIHQSPLHIIAHVPQTQVHCYRQLNEDHYIGCNSCTARTKIKTEDFDSCPLWHSPPGCWIWQGDQITRCDSCLDSMLWDWLASRVPSWSGSGNIHITMEFGQKPCIR